MIHLVRELSNESLATVRIEQLQELRSLLVEKVAEIDQLARE